MTSAEDPTFWTNSGIDPTGIVRAAVQYSQAGSVQSGGEYAYSAVDQEFNA